MEYTTALNQVDEQISCVSLRCNGRNEKDHSGVAGDELRIGIQTNVSEGFGVETIGAISRVMHIV